VLLGRALDRNRDALARLRDPDVITVIETPAAEWAGIVARLIKHEVLGGDTVIEEHSIPKDRLAARGSVTLFKRSEDGKSKKPANDNGELAAAMQLRCAIVGIAADPERLLPRDLVRLATHRIVVPPLDGSAVAAVIEAVTGRHPGPVDDELARRVTVESLMIAVRADLGAARSLARLTRIIAHDGRDAEPQPRLSELHGLGEAKQWATDLAADLRAYAAGKLPWSEIPRGCLWVSAPGNGKTTLARALAREADVHFVATSYAQWQSSGDGHLGYVTKAIRASFAEANRNRPCVVFIDEIDTIPARGATTRDNDWWTAITNCLLEVLDGFEQREGVVVIAACNDPSRLDPALVRSGRLDRQVHIPLPDLPALAGIFRTHLGGDLAGADLVPMALAARGHTGADVERWVREARGRARRQGTSLTPALLLDVVRGGEPEWPVDVRCRIGHHEAAHAVAMLALGLGEPTSLSIGASGGLAQSELGERQSPTRAYLEQYLVVLLAGRAGEELVHGEATAGAGGSEASDLARATHIAMQIESTCGLGHTGLVWLPTDNQRELVLHRDLQAAVRRTLDRAHAAAKELLSINRAALDALAAALTERGYLDRDEIRLILADAPLRRST